MPSPTSDKDLSNRTSQNGAGVEIERPGFLTFFPVALDTLANLLGEKMAWISHLRESNGDTPTRELALAVAGLEPLIAHTIQQSKHIEEALKTRDVPGNIKSIINPERAELRTLAQDLINAPADLHATGEALDAWLLGVDGLISKLGSVSRLCYMVDHAPQVLEEKIQLDSLLKQSPFKQSPVLRFDNLEDRNAFLRICLYAIAKQPEYNLSVSIYPESSTRDARDGGFPHKADFNEDLERLKQLSIDELEENLLNLRESLEDNLDLYRAYQLIEDKLRITFESKPVRRRDHSRGNDHIVKIGDQSFLLDPDAIVPPSNPTVPPSRMLLDAMHVVYGVLPSGIPRRETVRIIDSYRKANSDPLKGGS